MKAYKNKHFSVAMLMLPILILSILLAFQHSAIADEPPLASSNTNISIGVDLDVDLGVDLDVDLDGNSPQYQEYRVGGRLESITIFRKNQLTEWYRNYRIDTIWAAQENEIGEVPNRREWIIGTW